MTTLALRSLLARRTRAILTAIAIVLGVAMISGTMMLTDSIDRAFGSIFATSFSGTDALVSGAPVVEGAGAGNATVPVSLLAQVRALPEVEQADGVLVDFETEADAARLMDSSGGLIGSQGYVFGVDPAAERFNPMQLSEGRWASGADEIVIDAATASEEDLGPGDTVRVADDGRRPAFTVTGIARFGEVDSLGGVAVGVVDVATAQALHDRDGFDAIAVAARPGVSDDALLARLEGLAPDGLRVETGEQRADRASDAVAETIDMMRWLLLAFGGIALFVGAFVIANTLSITVAQRARELATLRTLGATRRQVLAGVIAEAATIGVAASVAGLALGAGLARGLSALFGASGLSLPEADLRLTPGTVLVALGTGLVVTLVASVLPAMRATRVAPVQAIREGAPAAARRRGGAAAIALVTSALGAASFAYGAMGDLAIGTRLVAIAAGFLALSLGLTMLAPRLVRPLAAVLGWPGARFGGASGALARENAVRNPGRTATTAAALMVGLALVTMVAVLGASLTRTDRAALTDQLAAGHVLSADDGYSLLPPSSEGLVARTPGVSAVSGIREERALVDGDDVTVNGLDPDTIASLYRFHPTAGAAPAEALAGGGAVVRESFAEANDIALGDRIRIVTPSGSRIEVPVTTIDDPPALAPLLGEVAVGRAVFDEAFPRPRDRYVLIDAPGASLDDLTGAVAGVPDAHVRTREAFVDNQVKELGTILNLLYVLLGLSVVVSLFGMVNTLALSVVERTRELGMLRVVGMTRRQVRAMVRHESVVTALIGAALGIPLGTALAAIVIRAMSGYDVGLVIPVPTIAMFTAIAIAAGVVAAIAPARRAARLRPLEALRHE